MPDFLRRALRTFVQAFLGVLVSSGILSAVNTSGVVDWSAVHKVAVSAAAAGVVAVVSLLQNYLEDSPKIAFPAIGKAVASSGQNPVTLDPAGPIAPVADLDPAIWGPKTTTSTANPVPLKAAPKKAKPAKKAAKKTSARRS